MKALVTGGSGFIGSHVVDKLREHGIEVRVFDGFQRDYHIWNSKGRGDIEFYQGNLLELSSLHMAMDDIDIIYHLGAVADVNDVMAEPYRSENINVRGTINVLEAARLSGRPKRVIYASTIWVYSDCKETKVDETTQLAAPTHLYTATKIASEYYCQCYAKMYNIPTTILRYGIPYGTRARGSAVIPIFVKKALNGERLTITGEGLQYRYFVNVEDLAEGNVLAIKEIAKNKIYNLEGREKITIRQIVETIRKLIGNVEIEYVPARAGDFGGKEISGELARKELGWIPKISFEEGVRNYIEWYKQEEQLKETKWEQVDNILKS